MTYDESLTWLNSTQLFGIKLGLENTRRLLAGLGNPEAGLRILHVAGTNGKGSVCAMLDAALRAEGLRTGLFTSPHLCDFRERIRVNGEMIPAASVAEGLSRLHGLCQGWQHSPTFFELATALALAHFAASGCEAVVLETGMGGRLDATNAVSPVVSVITPVAMDHAQWLGGTIAEIALEKAGIIKPGIPSVSAPQVPEAAKVLRERARSIGSAITFAESAWDGAVGLRGPHQKWNAAVAAVAVEKSGIPFKPSSLRSGLANVVWPARFQEVRPDLIVDGAHNPHAAKSLVACWKEAFGDVRPTVIFGALADKDCAAILRELCAIAGSFSFVPVESPRSIDPATFKAEPEIPSRVFGSLEAAVREAGGRPALITGSLFLAGEALRLLLPAQFGEESSHDAKLQQPGPGRSEQSLNGKDLLHNRSGLFSRGPGSGQEASESERAAPGLQVADKPAYRRGLPPLAA